MNIFGLKSGKDKNIQPGPGKRNILIKKECTKRSVRNQDGSSSGNGNVSKQKV